MPKTSAARYTKPGDPLRDTWVGATVPTLLGYVILVLLPVAFVTRPEGGQARGALWELALAGVLAAPLWSLAAEMVRGSRPRAPRDHDAHRRAEVANLILRGRMGTLWGLVLSYAGLIAVSTVASLPPGADYRPIYEGMLPGLALAVVAPIVARVVALGRHVRWAVADARSRRGELVERDDTRLVVRLDDGETVTLDAASTTGSGADASTLPADVWLAGGEAPPGSGHPYQTTERLRHGARLDSRSDRSFRRRAVAALVMELAVLPVVPAIWVFWLSTRR